MPKLQSVLFGLHRQSPRLGETVLLLLERDESALKPVQVSPMCHSLTLVLQMSNNYLAWELTGGAFVTTYLQGQNISAFTEPPPAFNVSTLPPPSPLENEDCLFLDVMVPTPIFNSTKGAPVIVWIFGGGYTGGSKDEKDQPFAGLLARSVENGNEGVILVSINYRLGLFVSRKNSLEAMY